MPMRAAALRPARAAGSTRRTRAGTFPAHSTTRSGHTQRLLGPSRHLDPGLWVHPALNTLHGMQPPDWPSAGADMWAPAFPCRPVLPCPVLPGPAGPAARGGLAAARPGGAASHRCAGADVRWGLRAGVGVCVCGGVRGGFSLHGRRTVSALLSGVAVLHVATAPARAAAPSPVRCRRSARGVSLPAGTPAAPACIRLAAAAVSRPPAVPGRGGERQRAAARAPGGPAGAAGQPAGRWPCQAAVCGAPGERGRA